MYKIIFTNRAVKDLKRISKSEQLKVAAKLKEYAQEPLNYAKKLSSPKIGTYRFRIGDYRVIFDLEGKDLVVLRIGSRQDIYKATR